MLVRATTILGIASLATALVGCGGSKTSAPPTSHPSSSARQCRHVGARVSKILARGLKKGERLSGGVYAVPSGNITTPWVFAARIRGPLVAGVAVWATNL